MTTDKKINIYDTVCGTGCGIKLEVCENRISALYGSPDHPTNKGLLCSKGKTLHKTINSPDRLLYPTMRDNIKSELARTSWEDALEYGASVFSRRCWALSFRTASH